METATKSHSSGIQDILASKVEPKNIEWLWPGFIMRGAITNLVGDPGVGKGLLACEIAARLTTGRLLPGMDTRVKPLTVAMFAREDDFAAVLRPRLEAMGADLPRIRFVTGYINKLDGKLTPEFDIGKERSLRRYVVANKIDLAIIDPLFDFMGDTQINKTEEVKKKLFPLHVLAQDKGVAFVNVIHLNKNDNKASYKTLGSIQFVGKARTEIVVANDKENPGRKIVVPKKSNYGPELKSLCYEVKPIGPCSQSIAIEWVEGGKSYTPEELIGLGANSKKGKGDSKMEIAEHVIKSVLFLGPLQSSKLDEIRDFNGIGEKTWHTARKRLGVVAEKPMGGNEWFCSLPKR